MSHDDSKPLQPSDSPKMFSLGTLRYDLISGLVVSLVALPLCLGIAQASDALPITGLIAGIIGGLVVGAISGSHTSVSGPAAGLTAIVAAQIGKLDFDGFLLAVVIAGIIQIGFGIARAGALSAFFPTSVIKGLLAAIGTLLILKQIPHLLGHDDDPEGEMSLVQPDHETTFSELYKLFDGEPYLPAVVIGLICLAVMLLWNKSKFLKRLVVPAPLIVVVLGVGLNFALARGGASWTLVGNHLVDIPVSETMADFVGFLAFPDFTKIGNSEVYIAAITIAVVASLETLLNLEAVDKLDDHQRNSPPSRELVAQGCGNLVAGLIGGLPVTSVVVRGSVNVHAGGKTKLSTIVHGILLVACVAVLPTYINMIPKAALAAILIATGIKLASPQLFMQMWKAGPYQFIPFIVTLVSIVLSDLLIGILIGLGTSVLFILNSSLRRPVRRIVEKHLSGDVTRINLANQVSFLNRAALMKVLDDAPHGSHVMIDASDSDYIDPDVLSLIREYKDKIGPARGVVISTRGFKSKYQLHDEIQYADYSTRELQHEVTADQVLEILKEGNRRFRSGERLTRDFGKQVSATSEGQNPLAVVLSCSDSRVPTELVFDLGLGDIFSVRVVGNVIGTKSLASIEHGVAVAGVKLVLVLGHTRCGAVASSVKLASSKKTTQEATGCEHLNSIVEEITPAMDGLGIPTLDNFVDPEAENLIDEVARRSVQFTVRAITERSSAIRQAVESGQVRVVGAMYDIRSGEADFFEVDQEAQTT